MSKRLRSFNSRSRDAVIEAMDKGGQDGLLDIDVPFRRKEGEIRLLIYRPPGCEDAIYEIRSATLCVKTSRFRKMKSILSQLGVE